MADDANAGDGGIADPFMVLRNGLPGYKSGQFGFPKSQPTNALAPIIAALKAQALAWVSEAQPIANP